ncbi:hypothetical protein D3C77_678690 [compost metagenome]
MGGMCRNNELDWPWSFVFSTINKFLGDLGEFLNENLLHLRMKVCLRFFNEDQMYPRLSDFSSVGFIEACKLKKYKDKVSGT